MEFTLSHSFIFLTILDKSKLVSKWKRVAAEVGNIDSLYELLEEDPEILETIHQKKFSDTLLHISASVGQTLFTLEIMNLKPNLGRKLNARGFSALDLALRNGHIGTVQRLICFHPQLVRVRGRGRITPLHYVAEVGEVDLLVEFLLLCPLSIEDLTITGETAVHVAVKNRRLSAFKVLLGLLQRTDHEDILNWKDEKGNTVLHIATSTSQTEVVELLAKDVKVKVNALNQEGATALDIAMTFHRDTNTKIRKALQSAGAFQAFSLPKAVTPAEFLSSHPKPLTKTLYALDIYLDIGLSGDMRNALLVVVVLIATATYQALLQPPGGYSQQTDASSVQHESQLEDSRVRLTMAGLYFYPFICLNSIAFIASIGIIFMLLPVTKFNMFLQASLTFLILSYIWSLYTISPQSIAAKNSVLLLCPPFLLIISARTFRLRKRLFPTMRILNDSSINPFSSLREQLHITRSVHKKYWQSVAAKGEQLDINGT